MMSAALSAALCLGMTTMIQAEETVTNPEQPVTIDVTGSYISGGDDLTVYNVDIEWSSMDFSYRGSYKGQWNPDTLTYDGAREAGWDSSESEILVTNRSNAAINVTSSYKAEAGYEGVQIDFEPAQASLVSADSELDDTGKGKASVAAISVTASGDLPKDTEDRTRIGTITVKID